MCKAEEKKKKETSFENYHSTLIKNIFKILLCLLPFCSLEIENKKT